MECNQTSVSFGQCRCCLTEGNHQDLMKEYSCDGSPVIYSDIFVDCFNIFLCTDVRMTTLICTPCVQQLRNAVLFKSKVLDSEKILLQALNPENGKQTVFLNCNINVASDGLKEESSIKEEIFDTGMDSSEYDPECIEEEEELDSREKGLLERFSPSSLRILPTRPQLRTLCSAYFLELEKLKGKTITAKLLQRSFAATADININPPFLNSASEKLAHITNITTLLTFSNLTAFKTKYKNGFPCFYCGVPFENLNLLRNHQQSHKKENLMAYVRKKYKPGRPDCLVVYAEVTDLKCTICEHCVPNLQDLKIHLTNVHKKTIHLQYTDRVIPFKILNDGYQCQVCCFFFETFGTIERHMNTHFRNFVCDQCGAGFIAKNRLKIHIYNIHRGVGVFACEICEKSFHTRNKLKVHFNLVHKMVKKIKCPKCPARFSYYFVCQKHLVDVHGVAPIKYKCNVCDKAFTRRFHLSNHIKKDHLDEKDWCCQLCSYTCFSNSELKVHMVKQHGEKYFECPVCEKCYASHRSLKQHINVHR